MMDQPFTLAHFRTTFPDDLACLEEIRRQRFPHGIFCKKCKLFTRHYKLTGRVAYACKLCRTQMYPLTGTIFEKSTTPLRLWFYAIFIMTHTRATITIKQLQKELGVTYKTAWRIYTTIRYLMDENDGDLLKDLSEREYKEHKWVFFNKLQFTFVQKQEENS
jgi:transposase-like protein